MLDSVLLSNIEAAWIILGFSAFFGLCSLSWVLGVHWSSLFRHLKNAVARQSSDDQTLPETTGGITVIDPPLQDASRTGQIIVVRSGGNWWWVCCRCGVKADPYIGVRGFVDCVAHYRHSHRCNPTASHHGTLVDIDGMTDEEVLIVYAHWFGKMGRWL